MLQMRTGASGQASFAGGADISLLQFGCKETAAGEAMDEVNCPTSTYSTFAGCLFLALGFCGKAGDFQHLLIARSLEPDGMVKRRQSNANLLLEA